MTATDRPIGYWLKHLHEAIERQFGATLAAFGATRRDWQVLNVLHAGARGRAELTEVLAPFWTAEDTCDAEVARLADLGWLTGTDPVLLTDTGRDTHARLFDQVRRNRERLLDGLTTDQYTQAVETLAAMAHNVAAGEARPAPAR